MLKKPKLTAVAAMTGLIFGVSAANALHAATYYVSTAGNDSSSGSFATPWRTIQKAANTMVAGDTTYIRGGTYRETITLSHSGTAEQPIVLEAYQNEIVTVSGLNVVNTAWTQFSGNIYSTPFPLGLGNQDQIFIDGNMGTWARWPNDTDGDLFTHNAATADTGSSTSQITDSDLPVMPTDFYKGAVVWMSAGVKWTCTAWTITGSANNTIKFTMGGTSSFNNLHSPGNPKGGDVNYYYISGLLGLLDSEREWYYDSTQGKLYLWVPGGGNPGSHVVEARARVVAFDLEGSFIQVNKIQIKGAKVIMAGNDNVLDRIVGTYMFHHNGRGMSYTIPEVSPGSGAVFVTGTGNVVKNSDLSYSAGSLVVLGAGSSSTTIDNNILHHVDYLGTYDSAVQGSAGKVASDGDVGSAIITRNTMYTAGRSLIHLGTSLSGPWKVKWNDISNPMIYTDDGSGIYTWGHDFLGSVVAYNSFHGNVARNVYGAVPGIYVDDWSENITVHHNVIYDLPSTLTGAIKVGAGSIGRSFYNNTVYNGPGSLIVYHSGGSANVANTLLNATAANFVDAANHDFRLAGGSTAINAAVAAAPWTDGYAGSLPDSGAYEFGGPPRLSAWTAGVGSTLYPDIVDPDPESPPAGLVNDDALGTGLNQFEYVGNWIYGKVTNCFGDDVHYANSGSNYVQFRFVGARIQLYAWKYSNFGNGSVSIDGGTATTASFTGAANGNYLVNMAYDSGNLTPGTHTLKLSTTGGGVSVDHVEVSPVNDIIVDNTDATLTGSWSTIAPPTAPGFYGTNYLTDGNTSKGSKAARFIPAIPQTDSYQVYGRWVAGPTRAFNIPYTITHAAGTTVVPVDQRINGSRWVLLGTYPFNAGTSGSVSISNSGTTGTVVADAVRLIAVSNLPPSVSAGVTNASAGEMGPVSNTFTISRNLSAGNLSVQYVLNGTATSGVDYTTSPSTGSVLIPDGQTTATVTVSPIRDSVAEGAETVILNVVPDSHYVIGAGSATMAIDDLPIDAWRLAQFGGNVSDPAIAGDVADPNGNGLSNLMEYALGGDPNRASGQALAIPQIETAGGVSYLTLSYGRLRGDILYSIEQSNDLATWAAIPDVAAGTQGGVSMRKASVLMDGTRKFLRLHVSRQ